MVAIAAMWKAIGVESEILNTDFRALTSATNTGDFEVMRFAYFSPYDDPNAFMRLLETDNPNNRTRYSNPELDRLMAQSDKTLDPAQRFELIREAERVALKDHAVIPIYFYAARRLISPQIEGWVDNVRNVNPTRFLRIDRDGAS